MNTLNWNQHSTHQITILIENFFPPCTVGNLPRSAHLATCGLHLFLSTLIFDSLLLGFLFVYILAVERNASCVKQKVVNRKFTANANTRFRLLLWSKQPLLPSLQSEYLAEYNCGPLVNFCALGKKTKQTDPPLREHSETISLSPW